MCLCHIYVLDIYIYIHNTLGRFRDFGAGFPEPGGPYLQVL
jgi:hypothetical protein